MAWRMASLLSSGIHLDSRVYFKCLLAKEMFLLDELVIVKSFRKFIIFAANVICS